VNGAQQENVQIFGIHVFKLFKRTSIRKILGYGAHISHERYKNHNPTI